MLNQKTLEKLLVSKVRVKILKLFLLDINANLHLRAIVREVDEEINAVRRELIRLEDIKLFISTNRGNRKFFCLNHKHPMIGNFIDLFNKSFGLGGEIIKTSKSLGEISFAMLSYYYTHQIQSEDQLLHLIIIGDKVNVKALDALVKVYEDQKEMEIHYTVMKPSEFVVRKRRRDPFTEAILETSFTMLIGTFEELMTLK